MLRFLKTMLIAITALLLSACSHHPTNTAQGYIEGKFTYVASQTSGVLNQILVERGSNIQKGAPLFKLDLNPQLAVYNQMQAQLQQSKSVLADLQQHLKRPTEIAAIKAQKKQVQSQLALVRKTVSRYQQLYRKRLIEKAKLDDATFKMSELQARLQEINEHLKTAKLKARPDQIAAARANVKAATAAVKQAEWQLKQKTIYSQSDGEIFDTFYRSGEVVPVNHPVLSLLDPKNIFATFFATEPQLSKLHLKQTVKLMCDQCATTYNATINFISPKAEFTPPVIYSENTRSKLIYRIEARLSKQALKTLHPGQPITVIFNENRKHAR